MTTTVTQLDDAWSGGKSPFDISWGKMMMWFFLVSDAFVFATLLITYGSLRFSNDWWPSPTTVFSSVPVLHGSYPLVFVTLMTFILIVSSVTMVLAVYDGHHGNKLGVVKWLFWTIIGGLAFLGSQAFEWTHLIHQGLSLTFNPFVDTGDGGTALLSIEQIKNSLEAGGPKAFGMVFFVITGFHGSHVLSGVIINTIILINVLRNVYEKSGNYEMVEKVGLYWHFVDLVWVFVFLLFYLV